MLPNPGVHHHRSGVPFFFPSGCCRARFVGCDPTTPWHPSSSLAFKVDGGVFPQKIGGLFYPQNGWWVYHGSKPYEQMDDLGGLYTTPYFWKQTPFWGCQIADFNIKVMWPKWKLRVDDGIILWISGGSNTNLVWWFHIFSSFIPNLGEMIQFDLRIFFRWVGKTTT